MIHVGLYVSGFVDRVTTIEERRGVARLTPFAAERGLQGSRSRIGWSPDLAGPTPGFWNSLSFSAIPGSIQSERATHRRLTAKSPASVPVSVYCSNSFSSFVRQSR